MDLYIECPHCECFVEIASINCGIFRHAVYRHNMQQMNSHASQGICERAIINDEIYGCGKAFRIDNIDDKYVVSKCDYI